MRATLVNAARSIAEASTSTSRVSKGSTAKPSAAEASRAKKSDPKTRRGLGARSKTKEASKSTPRSKSLPDAPVKRSGRREATSKITVSSPPKSNPTRVASVFPDDLTKAHAGECLTRLLGSSRRINDVVSPELCDDVISYLGPTLEKYRGCTIVDLNPGCSIWSSKLHAHLQPKRHYLLESDPRMIETFIKPLLAEPDCRYVHIDRTIDPVNFGDVIAEELVKTGALAPDTQWTAGDPRERQLNHDVLFTGNIARWNPRVGFLSNQQAKSGQLIAHAFTKASVSNAVMHKYGLVRALFWMREAEKGGVLCLTDAVRRASSARMNMDAKTTEAVGVTPLFAVLASEHRRRMRSPWLETLRLEEVQRRTKELGMALPPHRTACLANPAQEPPDNIRIQSPFESLLLDEAEIEAYTADCEASFHLSQYLPATKRRLRTTDPHNMRPIIDGNIEFDFVRHIKKLWSNARQQAVGAGLRTQHDIDNFLRIMRLEASVYAYEVRTNQTLTDIRSRIKALEASQYAHASTRGVNYPHTMALVKDELQSAFSTPPVLARDRRDYEPMQAAATDFWPVRSPLTLVDFIPEARDMSVPGIASRADSSSAMFEMCKRIFPLPSSSLLSALNQIGPNAGRDLIAMVPELQDPRRGGRLHPEHMRVRMLSHEMTEQLAKAFWEWPFRPPLWQLEARGLEYQGDPDAV